MRPFAKLGADIVRAGFNASVGTRRTVPLAGMTLEPDDVRLARKWLRQPERWRETAIVSAYERAFAQWNGSRYAFAFSAGRKALSACLHALDIQPGDEIIIPGYTCIGVQNALDYAGVTTRYCDIELDTFGPELESIALLITPRTKAILVQHLYGLVCRDFEGILQLARQRGLKVIEDCAHVTGATFRERRVGTFGDVAYYSSEWTKIFTSIAGGIAVTDDPLIAKRLADFLSRCDWPESSVIEGQLRAVPLAFLRARASGHWWSLPWAQFTQGNPIAIAMTADEIAGRRPDDYFTRMPAPAADLALNQLRKIDRYNELRRRTAGKWQKWCDRSGYKTPLILAESQPVFLRYPILVEPERKKNTVWAAKELGIELGVWFRTHLHPSPRRVPNCPNADKAVAQCVNFPCLPPEETPVE